MAPSPSRRPRSAVVISLLLLVGALLLIGMAVRHLAPLALRALPGAGTTTVTQGVVVEQMRAVAKLVTSETSVRDVVVYQNRRLGSTKRSLVVVTGTILAGIDLDAGTQVDIDHSARRVTIVLPRAKVMAVEVTQLRTYDERSGLWNPFRPEDRDTIYQLAREQLAGAAVELGTTVHAEESARRLLGALIHAEGYAVDVKFTAPGSRPGNGADDRTSNRAKENMEQVSLEYRGKQISATLDRGQTLSGKALPRGEPPMWYVTIGGTALTKFPATRADTEASVRGRVLAWLEANPDMLDRDQIVLGGG
ncbi:MAG: DUF4230 domain-containing protein [Gemmatimonadales bacterium]